MFVALELSKSSWVMADEVFFRDFHNRREVAGYLGLASSAWASGRVTGWLRGILHRALGAEPGRTSPQGSDCRQQDGSDCCVIPTP
jgi:hypothetical protein